MYDYDSERLIFEICSKQDNKLQEAIMISFGMGFGKEIDMEELSLVNLLSVLKAILLKLPSPLFTRTLGAKYCSLLKSSKIEDVALGIIKDIPEDNFNVCRRVISCLYHCSLNEKPLIDIFCKFFSKCFIRDIDVLNHYKTTEMILFHLISNYKDIPLLQKNKHFEKENKKVNLLSKKNPLTVLKRNSNFAEYRFPSIDIGSKLNSKDSHLWNVILQFVSPYLSFPDTLVNYCFIILIFNFFLILLFFFV